MTASELRELASALNYQSWSEWHTENENKFAQAAEILELIAWAEENKLDVQRGQYFWWSRSVEDGHAGEKTLIGLLRRAKEAVK